VTGGCQNRTMLAILHPEKGKDVAAHWATPNILTFGQTRKLCTRRKIGRYLLSFVLMFDIAPCLAVSEQDYMQEFPVVLSASRLRQPASEAPNAVTVIDRAMIKASGFRTIADLFRLVPGMYVDYKDGYTPIVSYHGATDEYTRRMQVLVDGRSVYLPPFNTVDWADLPLSIDDIERIEVVRGPAATSYGSNSIMGVINIITLDASALNGATLSAAKGNADNAGISDIAAHFGKSGEHLDYRFTFGRRSDNGFNFPAGIPTYYNISDDSSTTSFASLRGNYHPNGVDNLDFQIGFSKGTRAAGYSGLPVNPLSPPREISNDSGYQQLTWLRTLNHGDDIQLRYYHISRNSIDEKTTPPAYGSIFLPDNVHAHRDDIELQHTVHTSETNRFVWGGGMRHDSVDAVPELFTTAQSLRQYRLFAHDEWHISPLLILNGGAMLEDDGMGNVNVSPRAVLNYHIATDHTLRAGVSVAYRNPALVEEYVNQQLDPRWAAGASNFLSDGGLRPERTLSREIGYLGKFASGLSVDMRAYSDQVSDIIYLDKKYLLSLTPYIIDGFRNEFAARYTGLEGTVKYSWGEQGSSLILNYSRQKVSCDLVGTPFLGLAALPFFQAYVQDYAYTVPLNSGSLLYIGQMGRGISFSAGYYQQGAVKVLDGVGPQPLTRRVDVRIARQIGPSNKNIAGGGEVALVLQNVFQENIVGYSGYVLGRRAYLTATVNF
jgi:iron complex outermembrane recepter protein